MTLHEKFHLKNSISGKPPPLLRRSRLRIVLLIGLVVPLGLFSRADLALLAFVAEHAGDTLWALLVFLLTALLLPSRTTWQLALAALAFAFIIEFSQLYQAPWLDALRRSLPGRLVLGAGFLWIDLLRYTVGVILAALTDMLWLKIVRP